MHYLYTFHTGIDDVDQRNITGHWRSPDSGWQNEMVDGVKMENRGNLSNVQWVVLSPGLEWSLPNDWNLVGEGNVDFMNGGGLWEIWSTHTIE
ncbi:MAG: hypothetical protein HOB52_08365 [Euryarchaeota archaeon]|nr:hypothetical protein [Euryarchaeota archaeon]